MGVLRESRDSRTADNEFMKMVSQGKEWLETAFDRLRVSLDEEEALLLAEVDRCSSDINDLLSTDSETSLEEQRLQDAYTQLEKAQRTNDTAAILDSFVKVKALLAIPQAPGPDVSQEVHVQLRNQL